jgi:hypothetical protein
MEMSDEPRPATPLSLALAACRAVLFAAKQAKRHRGKYSLPDLAAAEYLAGAAIDASVKAETK